MDGADTRYPLLFRVQGDDVVVNKIWARNGAVAVVPSDLSGCHVSAEFPTFEVVEERLLPGWMRWQTTRREFWTQCDERAQGTSGKNRIRPEQFLAVTIPLPPLAEQRRIVAWLDAIAERVEEVKRLRGEVEQESRSMLLRVYEHIVADSPRLPMSAVARLVRRPVLVSPEATYHELGIRSFGKGTFHTAPVTGADLRGKQVFHIMPGDLLFNVVFAWEGAVAVAGPQDAGRIGSHRFLTCVPEADVADARFLAFHCLTPAGLADLHAASPGGAGRNRTLGVEALARIAVPVPPLPTQRWFSELIRRLRGVDSASDGTAITTACLRTVAPNRGEEEAR